MSQVAQLVYDRTIRLCGQARISRPTDAIARILLTTTDALWRAEEEYVTALRHKQPPEEEVKRKLIELGHKETDALRSIEAKHEAARQRVKQEHDDTWENYSRAKSVFRQTHSSDSPEYRKLNMEQADRYEIEHRPPNLPDYSTVDEEYQDRRETAQNSFAADRERLNNILTFGKNLSLHTAAASQRNFVERLAGIFLSYLQLIGPYTCAKPTTTTVPLLEILEDTPAPFIATVFRTFMPNEDEPVHHFDDIAAQLHKNHERAQQEISSDILSPSSHVPPPIVAKALFRNTVFNSLFEVPVPLPDPAEPEIAENHWYSHALLLARTRMGKTNVIQWRIANLLPQIAAGKASVVLMEPKGVLTRELLNLRQVWEMRDRVVILDPADTPVSVNVFDKGDGSDQAINETVGRVSRVIGTLITDLTPLQSSAIIFAIRAMFAVPGAATINTLRTILRTGIKDLPVQNLSPNVRDYFQNDFRPEDGRLVIARLNGLLANPVFEALFAGQRTTFDMLREIQAGKLIVVNCSSSALGGNSHLYGRFWIEEVQRCVWPRLDIEDPARRTPTTFIIDEAQDYIAEDLHIAQLLDKAAEARIGMLFGMQHMEHITDLRVRNSIYTNTTLKFAANTSADMHNLARSMGNTDPAFLGALPTYQFAYYGPDMNKAIRVMFPLVDIGKMPRMSEQQYESMRADNRKRYAYVPAPAPLSAPPSSVTSQSLTLDLATARRALQAAIQKQDWAAAGELQHSIIPKLEKEQEAQSRTKPQESATRPPPSSPPATPPTSPPEPSPSSGSESATEWR